MRARVGFELGEDVPDVALHRLLADEELRRDVGVRHAVGEELQDLALSPREHVVLVTAGQEGGHERRVDVALAARDLLDRAQQRLVRRLLQDVALRARLEAAAEHAALAVRGEDEDGAVRHLFHQLLRRLEPVHAGHADVHDHDVGPAALGERDGGLAVGGLADDADVRRPAERQAKPLAHDLVVVDDQAGDLGGRPRPADHRTALRCHIAAICELLCVGGRFEPHPTAVADAVAAGERAHAFTHGIGVAAREIGATAVQPLVLGEQLGPVPVERGEEVLARSRPQVEEVRPDPGRSRRARLAHDLGEQLGPVAQPRQDRRHPDPRVDPGLHEPRERAEPLARRRRSRLGAAPDLVVERRDGEGDRDVGAAGRLGEHVDVAHDQRPPRDDRERARCLREGLDAGAREAVAALRRLVRIGRCSDRDRLALPGRARELPPEHVRDVRLDADACAVAVVPRPVGSRLEGADVTERAAVCAAHVRVERPGERHPADAVEGAAAGLLPVLGSHLSEDSEHMFVPERAADLVPILRRASWTRNLLVPAPSR